MSNEIFRTVASLPPAELSAFLAVAQCKGFRSASRMSGLSSSALSHSVSNLESRLKVQLFHRTTKSVSLTEAGNKLYSRLTPVMNEIFNTLQELGDYSIKPNGVLKINADIAAFDQILTPLILKFLEIYSDMKIELSCDKRMIDLAEDGFDCGIRLLDFVPKDMVVIPIGAKQQHIVVAAPRYLENVKTISVPFDLLEHQCIQLKIRAEANYKWEFEKHGESFVIETNGSLVVDSSHLALKASIAGYGIAYVTKYSANSALNKGEIKQILDNWTPPYPGLGLYYPKHRQMSLGMRKFIEFSREFSKKLKLD